MKTFSLQEKSWRERRLVRCGLPDSIHVVDWNIDFAAFVSGLGTRSPRYLLRDRDRIFGQEFVKQVKAMGIKQVLSAPRSPWQRAYVERVIGTIRRANTWIT